MPIGDVANHEREGGREGMRRRREEEEGGMEEGWEVRDGALSSCYY